MDSATHPSALSQQEDAAGARESDRDDNDAQVAIIKDIKAILLEDPVVAYDANPNIDLSYIDTLRNSVKHVAVRYRRGVPQNNTKNVEDTKSFLLSLASLDERKVIIGKSLRDTLGLIKQPDVKFPASYVKIGKALYERFEGANWGAPREDTPDEIDTDDVVSSTHRSSAPRAAPRTRSSGPAATIRPVPAGHAIFGPRGIMYGIVKKTNGRCVIDPSFARVDFRTFGHNGLANGQCWPTQLAAVRDGAHGCLMAGIAGTGDEGAYSVVVSGGYEDEDHDTGTELHYSSAHTHTPTSTHHAALSSNLGVKALTRSRTTGSPVRVLRTYKGSWRGAPELGVRYDGLYTVVGAEQRGGGADDGRGGWMSFRLLRNGGQPPIMVGRPMAREVEGFRRAMEGY